jgi:hypothetical protein
MQWPSSCKSSSLPRRGSWIAERVPSSRGRKAWQPLHARSGRCAWNMMLVAPVLILSSGTSSPRRAPPVPSPNSSPTLAVRWRNARFFLLAVIKCIYLPLTYLYFIQDIEDRCLLLTSSKNFVDLPFQEHRMTKKNHMDQNPSISSICPK